MVYESSHQARVGRTLADSSLTYPEPRRPRTGAPNVVMIVLDDMGFAQPSCYGSPINTPRFDALAQDGLRYTNFHVTAICSASRACLVTGRNHHRVGMGHLSDWAMGLPAYSGRIPKSAGTLPRLLRDAGYNTFAVGKWHLTPPSEQSAAGPFERWPLGLGFERYYGFLPGAQNHWAPDLVRDNGLVEPPSTPEEGYHLTEDLTSEAIRLVQDQQQASPDKPFFLYFATGALHAPHHVAKEWCEPYRQRFDAGWDEIRESTFRRQLDLGIVPHGTVLTERPSWVEPWADVSTDRRALYARMMEVYAGFLTHTDAQVGRLIDFLDRLNVLENTIVMVLSDNGASADSGPHGIFNLGVRDIPGMIRRVDELGGTTSHPHQPWGWAWAGNTPFRLWKNYSWLGGVRVPLIVSWPAGIASAEPGGVRTQFCHAIDLMPTALEAAGVEPPVVLDGVTQLPLDGSSISATFGAGADASTRETQYFEVNGSRSIYNNGWKATTNHVGNNPSMGPGRSERELITGSFDFDEDRWSLFDLSDDFSEARDLSQDQPDKLKQLIELWWYEAGRNQVLPLMDGHFEQRRAAMEPPPYPQRTEYIYMPGGGPITTPPPAQGFRMTADIETERADPGGVIVAQGDWHRGWACYVVEGHLIIDVTDGGKLWTLNPQTLITQGRHTVEVSYQPNGDGSGSVALSLDRNATTSIQVGSAAFPGRRHGFLMVGRDRGLPVSPAYLPPFPFTDTIHRVSWTATNADAGGSDRR